MNNIHNNKIFSLNKFRKIKVDEYDKKESCELGKRKWVQTNPRFKTFDQTYFHAGDIKDLQKYAFLPLRYFYSDSVLKNYSVGRKNIESVFKLYKNIDYTSILNSFTYMFYKFKKGIFVVIRDNKLALFLPFSNINYQNNWYKKTYFSLEEKKLLESGEDYGKIKRKLDEGIIEFRKKHPEYQKINFNRKVWYANNCFFRNEFPMYEGDLSSNINKSMIEHMLKDRVIPDVEFFINNRDFPILKKDLTEPYNHIFGSDNVKIEKEFRFKKMAPIFSKCITNDFADILLPTQDDWMMASNKFFTDECRDSYSKETWDKINLDWGKKKNICIFRGSATGCGITIETNMRLKACDISVDNSNILDAGITDWNARMKKYDGGIIDIIDPSKLRFKLANKIDNIEKSFYKYILNIDGHVSAYRLTSELSMNSVVLLVKSPYKIWYSDLLEEYVHYVPVKADLEDLITQIKWCIKNDDKCKKIAAAAKMFFEKYLTKAGIFDYYSKQLFNIYYNKNFGNLLGIKKRSTKNIAIISCFRDKGDGLRELQRRRFIQIMNKILEPYCNFHIYIIEQSNDGELFNIGKLKNIGFELASMDQKFNHYVFSDIDTIPDYDLMDYYIKTPKNVLSLAIRGTRWEEKDLKNREILKPFLGALISFSSKLFTKINGYPNNFWGWGGEDDAIFNRLIFSGNGIVNYPKIGGVIDIEESKEMKTLNIGEKLKDEVKDRIRYEKLYEDIRSWDKNGVNSLKYDILERVEINRNTTQIKVDLLKKIDEKMFPNLFPNESKNYNRVAREVKKTWRDIKIEFI
jgi:hypothetical protein